MNDTLEALFAKCAKQEDGCWRWTYGRLATGYGRTRYNGKQVAVHRLVAQLTAGRELRSNEFVCHRCNFKLCINPDHLYIGDAITNGRDRAEVVRKEKERKILSFFALQKYEQNAIRRARSRWIAKCKANGRPVTGDPVPRRQKPDLSDLGL